MSIRSRTPGVASDRPLMSRDRGPAYSMKTMGNKAMPLHKGAKPGSKEFGENIATEIKAGKPPKQAQAIAYSESGEHRKSHKSHSSHHRHKEHR